MGKSQSLSRGTTWLCELETLSVGRTKHELKTVALGSSNAVAMQVRRGGFAAPFLIEP